MTKATGRALSAMSLDLNTENCDESPFSAQITRGPMASGPAFERRQNAETLPKLSAESSGSGFADNGQHNDNPLNRISPPQITPIVPNILFLIRSSLKKRKLPIAVGRDEIIMSLNADTQVGTCAHQSFHCRTNSRPLRNV